MQDWFAAQAIANPEKIALKINKAALDFKTLAKIVNVHRMEYSSAIPSLRLVAGQAIAILINPSSDGVFQLLGAIQRRLVIVPLNTRLTRDEIQYQVEHSDSKLLLHSDDFIPLFNKDAALPFIATNRIY